MLMRHLVLALAATTLGLSGCGKKETTGNTSAVDEALTARDFATSDATAIDAATGADANMAADVEFNALDNADAGNENGRANSSRARSRPRDPSPANDTADAPAPEPASTPAETNTN
jgi:hypothetical protein